jgi:hypothetical protein
MNMKNDAAKFDSIVHRDLHRKNVNLRPLRLLSFLGITMGVLMLMAMAAPSAHAFLLTYYNFNTEADGTTFPFTSNTTAVPGTQQTHLVNDATFVFPAGVVEIDASAGTTLNQWPGGPGQPADATGAGGALDLMGNANLSSDNMYCFDFGGISTTGKFDVSLSFAIASIGNGGQFDTLTVEWGTNNSQTVPAASYPNSVTLSPFTIGTNTSTVTYQQVTGVLGAGADDLAAGTYLWIQFCFSGSGNNANGNHTFIDNIQVTAVPEPSTYIGGLLGIIGLSWYQRRRFARFLGLRPA